MKKPNSFIIGAPKCGTTSLATWLREHPQVFVSDPKEPRYFNTDFGLRATHSLEEYEEIFYNAKPDHIAILEASTTYLCSKNAVQKILEYSPTAKFIVMLRKPQDMVISWHAELCKSTENQRDIEVAWRLQEKRAVKQNLPWGTLSEDYYQYGKICQVGTQLKRVQEYVPRDRLLVVFLEDIRRNPQVQFNGVLNFLGVSPFYLQKYGKMNERQQIKSFALRNFIRLLVHLKNSAGITFSTSLLKPLNYLNKVKRETSTLSDEFRKELDDYYFEEINIVKNIVGRVPDEWI